MKIENDYSYFFEQEISRHPSYFQFGKKSQIIAGVFLLMFIIAPIIMTYVLYGKLYTLIPIMIIIAVGIFSVVMYSRKIPELIYIPFIGIPLFTLIFAFVKYNMVWAVYGFAFVLFDVWFLASLAAYFSSMRKAEKMFVDHTNYKIIKEMRDNSKDFVLNRGLDNSVDFSKMDIDSSNIKKRKIADE